MGSNQYIHKDVSIKYVYGENGMKHKWTMYKIEGNEKLMNYKEISQLGTGSFKIIDDYSPTSKVFRSEIS